MNNNNQEIIQLTDIQKDALGEIGNICMSSAATTLHDILSRRVTITTPSVSITSTNELSDKYSTPYVVVEVSYTEGILGNNVLVIKTDDVKVITSIMLGEEKPNLDEELGELHLSAIGEVMNQMMGASSTALSTLILRPINISPPNLNVVNISENKSQLHLKDESIISIKFILEIENLLETEILLLMPYEFGKKLVDGFLQANNIESSADTEPKAIEKQASQTYASPSGGSDNPIKQADNKQGNVKSVTLQSFDNNDSVKMEADNIELLMDVPLQITVELGRTKKYLKDILELNLGSIVSLEKPAGDLIDVMVNGKLIAKGEVVVIDDNFGVRITDIVSPNRRYNYPK